MPKIRLNFTDVREFRDWFEQHVTLEGKPYTLDLDQARAVCDEHKNTLVTARAGSGKTRVIVAKIAYLVASGRAELSEIAAFMFNRTAAAEVNERIGAVRVDGHALRSWSSQSQPIRVASTFHKYALDLVKAGGERPQLISETEHDQIIRRTTQKLLEHDFQRRLTPRQARETLQLVSSFIARAGQRFSSCQGLNDLCQLTEAYCGKHAEDANYAWQVWLHRLCLAVYQEYLLQINAPYTDFNMLMAHASAMLSSSGAKAARRRVAALKYLLVDEYQDFSDLFFNLIRAIRQNCPEAHLFAVGDDWQAINRFAGSDVNYFIHFDRYFPEDAANIPLLTNYRSAQRIVRNANQYMIQHYDSQARPARAFRRQRGKIYHLDPLRTKFDATDLDEDALGDARFQLALAQQCGGDPRRYTDVARVLKTVFRIVKRRRREQVLLLHRHNFTSYAGVTLDNFLQALRHLLLEQNILSAERFTSQIRALTMHKSKGLESDNVILLEANRDQIRAAHPHATIFELFGDTRAAELADQHRLLYVALTRAKRRLYVLSSDKKPVV